MLIMGVGVRVGLDEGHRGAHAPGLKHLSALLHRRDLLLGRCKLRHIRLQRTLALLPRPHRALPRFHSLSLGTLRLVITQHRCLDRLKTLCLGLGKVPCQTMPAEELHVALRQGRHRGLYASLQPNEVRLHHTRLR